MSVGLDIGSKTIKIAEVTKSGDKWSLKAAGIVGYTGVEIEHLQDEKDFNSVAGLVKKLFQSSKISSKDVGLSLPESQAFTRTIKFPLLTDAEIASAVKWEAEEYIPIPVAEAVIEHQVVERRERATPPEVLVLLVAAPKVLVEKYVKIASLAGLTPVFAETGLIALSRCLAPANQISVVVDFGARSTDLAIAKNQQLVFSRSIQTGGEAFTRAVAQSLGVTPAQAEEYKRTYGFSQKQLEGKVGGALMPVFNIVAEEIKKAIHYYQTEEHGDPPTSIVLSGGTAGLPDAVPTLARLVGLEVAIGNPFAKVSVSPDVAKNLANYAPLYSTAVGLALRND